MNNTELEEKLFSDHRIGDIVGGGLYRTTYPCKEAPSLFTLTLVTCQENIGW